MSLGRVLVLDPLWDVDLARRSLRGLDVVVEQAEEPAGDDVVGVLLGPDQPLGATHLKRLPRLQAVATCSTGFDHLDVPALAAAGVWASNVQGYCDDEVAEHTVAMIVTLLRGTTLLDRDVRAGHWDVERIRPRRIGGSRVGVVGFGRIGRVVARLCQGLGMDVDAYDPLVPASAIRLTGVEPQVELPDLLARVDVVTLHVPLRPQTAGMIDTAALAAMRPGAFLVNCARAGLVDHAALGESLRAGHLGGAALDVLPQEPPGPDEPAIHAWPRTIVNPHAAWYSPASRDEPYRRAGADLRMALSGGEPVGALARPAGI